MAPDERSPLLVSQDNTDRDERATESSPLLSNEDNHSQHEDAAASSSTDQPKSQGKKKFRWASFLAIFLLAGAVVAVIVLGFLVPPAVQKYVENAVVLEPTGLSLEEITQDGVRARIQANFRLDGSRVKDENARRIGRFATGIMRQLGTEETKLSVYVPQYGDALLGSVVVPPITLSLVDGHNTVMDFVTNLNPGDSESLRTIVNEWLDGKLDHIKLTGKTDVKLKSGFLPLGTHNVVESMVFEANQVPTVPEYEIEHLNFDDVPVNGGKKMGIGANVTIIAFNEYPVGLTVPPMGFEVLVPDCDSSKPYIVIGSARSLTIDVKPNENVTADGTGLIQKIPDALIRTCPDSKLSPLDEFVDHYLKGENATVYIRGKKETSEIPDWLGDIFESLTVPITLPGQSFDDFIRNLTLTDVDFKFPSPFAGPNDPAGKPRVSGIVEVLAILPDGFNVDVSVESLRSIGDLIYKGKKFGELNLRKWQTAKSEKITDQGNEDLLKITSKVTNAPIDITDNGVFSDLMSEMLFGGDTILLDVHAQVDAKVGTVLGPLTLKQVPANGQIPVNGMPGDLFGSVKPHVGGLVVLNTSSTGVNIKASVNFTNPTPYTAKIPLLNIHVVAHDHLIGEATVEDVDMALGKISDVTVRATWDPLGLGGEESQTAGRKLLSDYLSGKNTTVTLRSHRGSIPGMPALGEALSKINMTFTTPRIELPGDDDDEDDDPEGRSRFIRGATFHIFSSTAAFKLASPLRHNTVHIERINATAYYNHTEAIGWIIYDEPFDVPPGISSSPRLPVDWDLDSVGYDKINNALGGSLKLDAQANVTVRLGNWIEEINYRGKGIGAKVRL